MLTGGGADGIGSPGFLPVDLFFYRDILSVLKSKSRF
jgi:hypothetical protein